VFLLQDSIILYNSLNEGILHLFDVFWKLHQKEARKVIEIYKLFIKETDALISLYEIGRRFIHKLPAVNKIDSSIIGQMEQYANTNAPKGSGDGYEDDDTDKAIMTNMNSLTTQAGHNYDEGAYGAQGSNDSDISDSGDEDDPDPFQSFINGANNPFEGFSFAQPVFYSQPPQQQPQQVAPTVQISPNPFQMQNNPAPVFSQQQTVVTNPFLSNNVQQPMNPFQTIPQVTQTQQQAKPVIVGNPFLTTPTQFTPTVTSTPFGAGPLYANSNAPTPFSTGQVAPASQNPFLTNQTTPGYQQNPFK